MKKPTITRVSENTQTFLLATGFLAFVLFLSYLQWFA